MDIIVSKTLVTIESIKNVVQYQPSDIQRMLNTDHVDALVKDQKMEFERYGQFSMLQSITCADYDGKRYILDGQHRIAAFKRLHMDNYPLEQNLPLVIYTVSSLDELKEYYVRINKHHPINPLEISDAWFKYGKNFCSWLCKEYSGYIKNHEGTSHCPHINLNELMIYIKNKKVFERIPNSMEIINLINKIKTLNSYFEKNINTIRQFQFSQEFEKRFEKCIKKDLFHPCFLGVWRQFEWLEIALYLLNTDRPIDSLSFSMFHNVRAKIPKILRCDVWKKRNSSSLEGTCFVCNNILCYENMECGHIIPHVYGGTVSLENLEPICKTCNRDMGIMNLYDYKNITDIQ